jgi:DUF1680 family protein
MRGERLVPAGTAGGAVGGDHAPLYVAAPSRSEPVELIAVPYFAWANRDPGEMLVWINERR